MASSLRFSQSAPQADPSLAHRVTSTTVTLRGPDGAPLADTGVVVRQVDHAVSFGCTGFEFLPPDEDDTTNLPPREGEFEAMAQQWLGIFNTATLPFYWGQFEPSEGSPKIDRLLAGARWFCERGVRLKGHPLVWHTIPPQWLAGRPTEEIEQVVRERVRRDVTAFTGVIDTWDAINEVVIMPVFENEPSMNAITQLSREIGRYGIMRLAFEEARAANPNVTLLLNDFNMTTAYDTLIEGALEAGIQIDALGLQSHMHQGYWGEELTLKTLERFSRYGLPIHFTENTLLSGDLMPAHIVDLNDYQPDHWPSTPEGEERQADEIVRHYRTLMSHPSVESITYWNLFDRGMWLGAPGGLVRTDGTEKPAYHALRDLVRGEWWLADTHLRTDANGRVDVAGWKGTYEAELPDGTRRTFTLDGSPDVDIAGTPTVAS